MLNALNYRRSGGFHGGPQSFSQVFDRLVVIAVHHKVRAVQPADNAAGFRVDMVDQVIVRKRRMCPGVLQILV